MLFPPIRSTRPRKGIPNSVLIGLIVILFFWAFEISVHAQESSPFERAVSGTLEFEDPPNVADLVDGPEYSGIAYSATTNSFFIVHDEIPLIYEYSLEGRYMRTITNVSNNLPGGSDLEGISWMYDNKFVIGLEGYGEIWVVTINPGQTTLSRSDVVYTVTSPIPGGNRGAGIEGVSFDYSSIGAAKERFFVLQEGHKNPPVMIHHIDQDGAILSQIDITRHMFNGTGIHHSANENALYVLYRGVDPNDGNVPQDPALRSSRIFKLALNGDKIWEMRVGGTSQAEGLTLSPNLSKLWVAGEPTQYVPFTNTESPAPVPTAEPTSGPPNIGTQTVVIPIIDGDDDAEERISDQAMDLDSSDLELIRDSDGDQLVGLRFQNIRIPADALIIDAKITFTADESQNGPTSLTIFGEATPRSASYRWDAGNISNRGRTTARVVWNNLAAWSTGQNYDTPNLKSIIQEHVNASGWNSGNAIAFIISGSGHRTAESYNGSTSNAAKLTIIYSTDTLAPTPVPPTPVPPTPVPPTPVPPTPGPTVQPPTPGEFSCSLIAGPTSIANGGGEYSGITLNEDTNTFFIVDDSNVILEHAITGQKLRTISIGISGLKDTEGISWIRGTRFAITSEASGDIYVVNIAPGQTTLTQASYVLDTPVAGNNEGLEGVAYDISQAGTEPDQFYIVKEKSSPLLYRINRNGNLLLGPINLNTYVNDAAGIFRSRINDSVYVVSHESRKVIKLDSAGQFIGEISLGNFSQPEGITFSADERTMYVIGENSDLASYQCTVDDSQQPVGNKQPVLNVPASQSTFNAVAVNLVISATDADNDPLAFSATGLPAGLSIDPTTGEISGTPTTAASYTATITVSDGNGGSATGTLAWTVKPNRAPAVIDDLSSEYLTVVGYSLGGSTSFEARDPDGDPFIITAENMPPGITVGPDDYFEGTATGAGVFNPTILLTDDKGAIGTATTKITVYATNEPPVLKNPGPQSIKLGELVSGFGISATDREIIHRFYGAYSATGLPPGLTMRNDAAVLGRPTEEGTWQVTVQVRDAHGGSDEVTFPVTVGGPNNIPVVENIEEQFSRVNQPVSLTIPASDPDGDTLTFETVIELPPGFALNESTGVISGTPTENGRWNFFVDIKDPHSSRDTTTKATSQFAWTITDGNLPPVITAIPDQQHPLDRYVSLPVHATDADGDQLIYKAIGLPRGLTIDAASGKIIGTMTKAGESTVFIDVEDGNGGSDREIFNWIVEGENRPPTVSTPSEQLSQVEISRVNLQIVASDPDGDNFSYAAENLPSGLFINPGSGLITGTPTEAGEWEVTVTVTDSYGNNNDSTTVTFKWIVNGTPQSGTETDEVLYLSSTVDGIIGGITFRDEDIISYDPSTDAWSLVFDGSDVGLEMSGEDIDAFQIDDDGAILLSIAGSGTLPGIGTVGRSDIVRFVPTALGVNTAGTFEMLLAGSTVGLTRGWDNINAISRRGVGELVISLTYTFNPATGSSTNWADLMRLNNSSGAWQLYFDGSDVQMDYYNENIDGVSIGAGGLVHLNTHGVFDVPGLSGDQGDLFTCKPSAMGGTTACTFSMLWSAPDIGAFKYIDGIHVGAANTSLTRLGAFDEMPANGQEADLGDQHDDTLDNETEDDDFRLPSIYLPVVTQ